MTAGKPHSLQRGLASGFCLEWWKTLKSCKHDEISQKLLRLRRDRKVLMQMKGRVKAEAHIRNNIEECQNLRRATTSALPVKRESGRIGKAETTQGVWADESRLFSQCEHKLPAVGWQRWNAAAKHPVLHWAAVSLIYDWLELLTCQRWWAEEEGKEIHTHANLWWVHPKKIENEMAYCSIGEHCHLYPFVALFDWTF